MLVAVISDTHDNLLKLQEAVEVINSRGVAQCFHLGDVCSPFAANYLNRLICPYIGVFGNNDGEYLGISKITNNRFFKPPYLTTVGGCRFLLLHEGDIAEYIDESIDFVLYGHSHQGGVLKKGRQQIINPGTLSGYVSGRSTFALIDLNTHHCSIVEL
ncbi:MAG: YfcE family phosphodiesterase [Calditerrivibrio sp.]|nr:YfcE family phosphodiesterase [Calditerrivibrio sp.]